MNNGNDLAMLDNSVLCILTLYICLEKPKYFKSMCIINIILCIIFAIFYAYYTKQYIGNINTEKKSNA